MRTEADTPPKKLILLEAADAGRCLEVTATHVRRLARAGILRTAALTRRGRLFAREDIEALRQQRAQGIPLKDAHAREPHADHIRTGDDAPTHAVNQTGASRGAVSAADMAPAGRGERIR